MGKPAHDSYIEVKTPGDVTIYPLVCLHLGAAQCDYKFIKEHVQRIANDPKGRWVYMGDAGECTTKNSVGAVYEQIMNPHEQIEAVVDVLHPIRGKGLFGVRGNHGHRIFKDVGVSFDSLLCARLGIPFLGTAAWAWIKAGQASYSTYWHHGRDSGTALKAKINSAVGFAEYVDADALFTAHSHVAMDLPPAALMGIAPQASRVITKMRHQYICGSAYDSRTGYAQEKGYPPILPSYISVTFKGSKLRRDTRLKQQTFQVYRSTGGYELEHDYVEKYRGKLLV